MAFYLENEASRGIRLTVHQSERLSMAFLALVAYVLAAVLCVGVSVGVQRAWADDVSGVESSQPAGAAGGSSDGGSSTSGNDGGSNLGNTSDSDQGTNPGVDPDGGSGSGTNETEEANEASADALKDDSNSDTASGSTNLVVPTSSVDAAAPVANTQVRRQKKLPGTITSILKLYAENDRFVVKWVGGNTYDKFEVQVREALTRKATWRTVATVSDHRASITKVGSKRIKGGKFYLVRVRAVTASEVGEWSRTLLLMTPVKSSPRVHVYSHRGSSYTEGEGNTFKAFDRAIREGSKNLEQDVVLSKNGTLYVSHDLNAKYATGKNLEFKNLSNKAINRLRTKGGERIRTLAAVYKRYRNSVNYLVELKEGKDQVDAIVAFVKRYKPKSIIVQSNKIKVLKTLEEELPEVPKLCIVYTKKNLKKALACDVVDIVAMKSPLASKKNIRRIEKTGKLSSVFVPTARGEIKTFIKREVDTYFTNKTGRALDLERRYRKH